MGKSEDPPRQVHEHLAQTLLGEIKRLRETPAEPGAADIGLAEAVLKDAHRQRASDIHLSPEESGVRLGLRVDGVLLNAALIGKDNGQRLINQFKTLAGLDPVATFAPQDARLSYDLEEQALDLRVACAPCVEGEKLAIRVQIPENLEQRIDDLGLSGEPLEVLKQWLEAVEGMLVVAGPTASGKTTTLYALLHELKLLDRSIITIEDPVEYRVDGIAQMQVNADQGFTFAEGIKAMLRLDPDYLLVGETRDRESARAAVDAASSGRALLTSLHSRDAVGAITSLRNWGVEDYEIATLLQIGIGQRLIRTLCPDCRKSGSPTEKEQLWLRAMGLPVPDGSWHAVGCEKCDQLGYRGRTGVFEIWRLDEEDCDLILAHTDERTLRRRLNDKGYAFLLTDAVDKAAEGVTTIDELRSLGSTQRAHVETAGEEDTS